MLRGFARATGHVGSPTAGDLATETLTRGMARMRDRGDPAIGSARRNAERRRQAEPGQTRPGADGSAARDRDGGPAEPLSVRVPTAGEDADFARGAELDARERELSAAETKLGKRESSLGKRESSLGQREA